MRAVTAGVSEACAERTGLDHSQRGNDKHLGFTRGVWKPRWLDKSRPLDTVKAPGHQLVSADQTLDGAPRELGGRSEDSRPGAWV